MASPSLHSRPKAGRIVRYGKASKKAEYDNLVDDESNITVAPGRRSVQTTKIASPVKKNGVHAKRTVTTTREPSAKATDLFDVPSSGDEASPVKRNIPAALRLGSLANAAIQSPQQKLAPWETHRANTAITEPMERLRVSRHPAEHSKVDPGNPSYSIDSATSPRKNKSGHKSPPELKTMTASARLAMRKKAVTGEGGLNNTTDVPSKRSDGIDEQFGDMPRKRVKTTKSNQDSNHDLDQDSEMQDVSERASQETDILLESATSDIQEKQSGRYKESTSSKHIADQKPINGEYSHLKIPPTPRRPRQMTVEVSIPLQYPENPFSTGSKLAKDQAEPEQNRLWAGILSDDPTPQQQLKTHLPSPEEKPAKKRRTRLVDRLKAAAESSDDELDNDIIPTGTDKPLTSSHKSSRPLSSLAAQSSQKTEDRRPPTIVNPKITYAKQRSYLQEDSLEDGLLFDLQPQPTPSINGFRSHGEPRSRVAAKTEFDLDGSEDDQGPARLRTIHELRAAGRNLSFIQDTEAIIEDIMNHNKSGVGRRRSALMELVGRLMDKAYFTRFVAHGFEEKLIVEFRTAPDDIADFALACAIALMFSYEVSQQTLIGFVEGGVLAWLSSLLSRDVEVGRLANERRNNMSRAARTTLSSEFVPSILARDQLWDHCPPKQLTSRVVAMKGLELCVIRLRKDGNKDDLLSNADMISLIGERELNVSNLAEMCIAASTFEALSTSAVNLQWSDSLVRKLQVLLSKLQPEHGVPQQTMFLMLRLALNLTNDNSRNCEIFAQPSIVLALMDMVCANFTTLEHEGLSESNKALLDLLVLALGVMINLAERNDTMRVQTVSGAAEPIMSAILEIFVRGQRRAQEAESMEQSTTNVAHGYLAIMLANICQHRVARAFISSRLPGQSLNVLVEGVAEFVMHHERVDKLGLDPDDGGGGGGGGGREIWSTFTARLQAVLERLRAVQE